MNSSKFGSEFEFKGKYFSMKQISGLKTANFSISAIKLGEKGRGRWQMIIPINEQIKNYDSVKAVITRSGKSYRIKKIQEPQKGSWIAIVSGAGVYTRNTKGDVYRHAGDGRISVLTSGYGAFGDAGRIGIFYEYLVTMTKVSEEKPAFLRIRPAGGSHKLERYWLVFTADSVKKYTDDESYIEESFDFPKLSEMVSLSVKSEKSIKKEVIA